MRDLEQGYRAAAIDITGQRDKAGMPRASPRRNRCHVADNNADDDGAGVGAVHFAIGEREGIILLAAGGHGLAERMAVELVGMPKSRGEGHDLRRLPGEVSDTGAAGPDRDAERAHRGVVAIAVQDAARAADHVGQVA